MQAYYYSKKNPANKPHAPIEIIRKLLTIPLMRGTHIAYLNDQIRVHKKPIEKARSFIIDGRTIHMLKNIEKVIKENPNKKILVLSGDTHARGFEAYLKQKNRTLYHFKKKVYNILFASAAVGKVRPF